MTRDSEQDGGLPPAGNPPGLSQIAYQTGGFAAFRRALLTPLAGEQQLGNWLPSDGDLGLQALEWWAYLAEVLTFYNERIANGSYLRTAVALPPQSQQAAGLVRLLGYNPAPAVTAAGLLAAIRGAGAAGGALTIPGGLQVTSTPTRDVPSQLFEVSGDHAFTGLSDAVIGLPPDPALFRPAATQAGARAAGAAAPRAVLLAGSAAVSPGDQFVLVSRDWDGTTADWAVVSAQSAAAEQDPGGGQHTRLTLSSPDWHGLAAGDGSGAPAASGYRLQRVSSTVSLWSMSADPGGPPPGPAAGTAQTLTVPMASLARSISPGDNVLFTGSVGSAGPAGGTGPRAVQLLAQVTGYTEQVTRVPAEAARGAAAGPRPDVYISHAFLMVTTAGADGDVAALRSVLGTPAAGGVTLRYGFRDAGTLIPTPADTLDRLPVTVAVPAGLTLPDGPVALLDANGTGLLVSAIAAGQPGSVTLTPAGGSPGALAPPLLAPVRLLADLVPVTGGTTVVSETLGDGDPTVGGQTFTLRYSPLVYLPPPEPGGPPASTLSVSVNGVPWREVRAFSGWPPDDPVYVAAQLPDQSVQVTFGDGVNGARLPLGVGNVTATYRYNPSGQPPPPGTLSTVLQPQQNLGTVTNPVAISPGTAAEPAETTAAAAPATALLLAGLTSATAPLISLTDAERIAAAVSGVTRVRAYWTWDADLRCPAVTVYVASDTGTTAAVSAVSGRFPRGTRVPLRAAPARNIGLTVDGRVRCPPGQSGEVVRAATEALTGPAGLFSAARLTIGQRLHRSQVEGALTAGGTATVLSLRVRPAGTGAGPAGADEHGEARDEPVLDPGEDGYFSLSGQDLSISVVIR